MNVAELIERLKKMPQDMKVGFPNMEIPETLEIKGLYVKWPEFGQQFVELSYLNDEGIAQFIVAERKRLKGIWIEDWDPHLPL